MLWMVQIFIKTNKSNYKTLLRRLARWCNQKYVYKVKKYYNESVNPLRDSGAYTIKLYVFPFSQKSSQ